MFLKLKSCPYCSASPKLYQFPESGYYMISCENKECLVKPMTRSFPTAEGARDAWNLRKSRNKISKIKE